MSWCRVSGFSFSSKRAFSVISSLRPVCSCVILECRCRLFLVSSCTTCRPLDQFERLCLSTFDAFSVQVLLLIQLLGFKVQHVFPVLKRLVLVVVQSFLTHLFKCVKVFALFVCNTILFAVWVCGVSTFTKGSKKETAWSLELHTILCQKETIVVIFTYVAQSTAVYFWVRLLSNKNILWINNHWCLFLHCWFFRSGKARPFCLWIEVKSVFDKATWLDVGFLSLPERIETQ